MEVICLEDKAFYALIEQVVSRIKEQNNLPTENKWISPDGFKDAECNTQSNFTEVTGCRKNKVLTTAEKNNSL
jgi:hypothetical protein